MKREEVREEEESATPMQFEAAKHGDGLNSWYVAITRAETTLYLPQSFSLLLSAVRSGEVPTVGLSQGQIKGVESLLDDMRSTLKARSI